MSIEYTEFWNDNFYKNPPLTDEMIDFAEEQLKVKLPKSFTNLLKIQNGGYTEGFVYPMKIKTSWSENHIPLNEIFGIVLDEKLKSGHNILESSYLIGEWGLPEKQVIISGEGHYYITLDYRKSNTPSIAWIDIECNEDITVSDNFDMFVKGLVSDREII